MGKGKQNKLKERSASSYKREIGSIELKPGKREPTICFSLRDLDRNQGQGIGEWEEEKLLSLFLERIAGICQLTIAQATSQKMIKTYGKLDGDMPKDSAFKHPKHVPPDVTWCSMHVQGKQCVIGHFEDNVFHIVFLDKEHEFWPTPLRHT